MLGLKLRHHCTANLKKRLHSKRMSGYAMNCRVNVFTMGPKRDFANNTHISDWSGTYIDASAQNKYPYLVLTGILWDAHCEDCVIKAPRLYVTSIQRRNYLYAKTRMRTPWWQKMIDMMTSSNENIFHVTGPLWMESTGHRWIPLTKASDAELWCFLWSAPEQTVG